MKEFELLNLFECEEGNAVSMGDLIYTISRASGHRYLDANQIKDFFDYFLIKIRYEKMKAQTLGKLTFNESGFQFYSHSFETLDEVERAIKNKAFL